MDKLIILDLDGTLITSLTEKDFTDSKDFLNIEGIQNEDFFRFHKYTVFKRPGLDDFLKICFEYHKIAVWSASTDMYCQFICQYIFKENFEKLEFIKYGAQNLNSDGLKDLSTVEFEGSLMLVDDMKLNCDLNPDKSYNIPFYLPTTPDKEMDILSKLICKNQLFLN